MQVTGEALQPPSQFPFLALVAFALPFQFKMALTFALFVHLVLLLLTRFGCAAPKRAMPRKTARKAATDQR